tara:strand:- start:503 stop:1246 length:744 start_codon:yes stop_codon:yes gene_type:complete
MIGKFNFCKTQKKLSWFLLCFAFSLFPYANARAGGVNITSYGHSSMLIKGGGQSILLNPFKAVGCASGLQEPKVKVDVILASSNLADEGARLAKGIFLVNPGSYRIQGKKFEGFAVDHDRLGGRRYGKATIWQWEQAGLNFAHLGGSAAPLTGEDKVLLGRPDVLIIPVGGGSKVYEAVEAAKVVRYLKPRHIIPVQYADKRSPKNCNLSGVEPFLEQMEGFEVRQVDSNFYIENDPDDENIINLIR